MRTIAYIDGYNLYYGRLRNNGFKWIDVYSLAKTICKIQDPTSELITVKYFTAPVLARFASHGQDSNTSQNAYHRALKEIHGKSIDIIYGFHSVQKARRQYLKSRLILMIELMFGTLKKSKPTSI